MAAEHICPYRTEFFFDVGGLVDRDEYPTFGGVCCEIVRVERRRPPASGGVAWIEANGVLEKSFTQVFHVDTTLLIGAEDEEYGDISQVPFPSFRVGDAIVGRAHEANGLPIDADGVELPDEWFDEIPVQCLQIRAEVADGCAENEGRHGQVFAAVQECGSNVGERGAVGD
ncbi:MAG: hypothetical protein WBD41_04100 [Rhodococcus sp. (in: high G+C Gram-positive bacteria)]